jgi:hypothetical protein
MDKRELKSICYKEALENSVVSVEMIMNRLNHLDVHSKVINEEVLYKDYIKTILDLELSLAQLCILMRKMCENQFIVISNELRRDINSIIHSNRFDYNQKIIVYSQKGEEEVDLNKILDFCHSIID